MYTWIYESWNETMKPIYGTMKAGTKCICDPHKCAGCSKMMQNVPGWRSPGMPSSWESWSTTWGSTLPLQRHTSINFSRHLKKLSGKIWELWKSWTASWLKKKVAWGWNDSRYFGIDGISPKNTTHLRKDVVSIKITPATLSTVLDTRHRQVCSRLCPAEA